MELESFKIVPEEIDRLYFIKHDEFYYQGVWKDEYYLLARINCYDKICQNIYVEMIANCNGEEGFSNGGGSGTIYISFNPNIFIKVVLRGLKGCNKMLVYNSLKDDGFDVKDTPNLQHLCYKIIYKYHNNLLLLLPNSLKNGIEEFIKYQNAKIAYNT